MPIISRQLPKMSMRREFKREKALFISIPNELKTDL